MQRKNSSGVKLHGNHFVLWNQFHPLCVFFTTSRRASSRSFSSVFPISSSIYLRRLRLFQRSDIEDKEERCSRRRYAGLRDRSLLPVTPRSDFSWQSRKLRGSIWQKPRGFAYFIVALRILFQFSRLTSWSQKLWNSCKTVRGIM